MVNNEVRKKAENLVTKLNEGFSATKYPGDDNIVYDNTGDHLECNEVANAFRGKKWNEVPLKVLRHNHEALFFFTAEGYRYYLPAFLRAAAKSYYRAGNIPGTLVFSLTPPDTEGTRMTEFHNKNDRLEPNQKQIVSEFLEFLVEVHESDFPDNLPQIALNRFWKNFKS